MSELKEDPFFGILNSDFIYILNETDDLKLPNTSSPVWCMDCDHPLHVKKQPKYVKNNWSKFPAFEYKLNNYGFRSDNFSSELSGSNILYGGCSNTFALGLPIEYSWAYQVNKMMNKEHFFSIGVNSASTDVIVQNTLNYIRKIGNPAGIIILFPDVRRIVSKINIKTDFGKKNYTVLMNTGKQTMQDEEINHIIYGNLLLKFYQDVTALEMVCEMLNIPIMWSTWSEELNETIKRELSDKFNHYVSMLDNVTFDHWQKNEKIDDSMFWNQSREGHPPALSHKVWADVMFELWQKKYGSAS